MYISYQIYTSTSFKTLHLNIYSKPFAISLPKHFIQITLNIYELKGCFNPFELYALWSQITSS